MNAILVVEDDPLIQRYLVDLLCHVAGWPAERVAAQDLLPRLRRGPAALVLLDITLPGLVLNGRAADGLELSRQLKEEWGPAAPPVVLLTAHAFADDRDRFLAAARADEYVTKPIFDEAAFLGLLSRLIRDPN